MLHIFSKSSFQTQNIERIDDGDALLFIESAVYNLIKDSDAGKLLQHKQQSTLFYALESDLQVRGIAQDQLILGVEITDYVGFVQLTVDNPVICSWN